jgi:hypothetical protein
MPAKRRNYAATIFLTATALLIGDTVALTSGRALSRSASDRYAHRGIPCQSSSALLLKDVSRDSADKDSPQRQQEMLMEELSKIGAEKIAGLGVVERAKRAMLAEAIEDRIFHLTEEIEVLLEKNGTLAAQNRDRAIELAQQTKGLQVQYHELVSGQPSSVLQSLEALDSNEEE